MRDVESSWPEAGSHLKHSVGTWPALLNDTTTVLEWNPPKRMVLRARGWPVGEAQVIIEVTPHGDECVVSMREFAVKGPARYVPAVLQKLAFSLRNAETLHRLAYLAEGRERGKIGTVDHEEAEEKADDEPTT